MYADNAFGLGNIVHERRTALGWSQDELASRMGVSRRWVNEFENGKDTAQVRLVFDALTVLGLRVEVMDDVR